MRRILCGLLVLSCVMLAPGSALGQVALYTVSSGDGLVRRIDPQTGLTLGQTTIKPPGLSVTQGLALAVDPTTGTMYAVISTFNVPARRLVTVNPVNGQAVLVGDLGDRFAALAFDGAGQLFGVTGDGAAIPETLYRINKQNAAKTLLTALGNGAGGEALGYQPSDGLLYHASGVGIPNDPVMGSIFESVDPTTGMVTGILLSGGFPTGIQCFARLDASTFLILDQGGLMFRITTSGVVTPLGTYVDHTPKGLAFAPGPSYFESYGSGCAGSGGFVPKLSGSPSPNPGSNATMTISQGLGGAPGLLLFGIGTGAAPVVAACSLQIAPILPLSIPFALGGNGSGMGTLALGGPIPPATPPADVYLQAYFADAGAADGVAATAPVRLHLQ